MRLPRTILCQIWITILCSKWSIYCSRHTFWCNCCRLLQFICYVLVLLLVDWLLCLFFSSPVDIYFTLARSAYVHQSVVRSVRSELLFLANSTRFDVCARASAIRLRLIYTSYFFPPLCKQTKANRSNHFKHLELNIFSFGFFVFSRTKCFCFRNPDRKTDPNTYDIIWNARSKHQTFNKCEYICQYISISNVKSIVIPGEI